jgi:hypothetical protein
MNQVGYYTNLLTSEYRAKPNFNAFLAMLVQPFVDAGNCADSIGAAFDLDNAEGVQLDIIGNIVGMARLLPFTPIAGNAMMDDYDYKTLIRAKIVQNTWDGKIYSLAATWNLLFPDVRILVIDGMNMHMYVILQGVFPSILNEAVLHDMVIPRPEGVQIHLMVGTFPLFGFDCENESVSGFDVGNWVSSYTQIAYFGFDIDNASISGFNNGSWYS